MNGPRDLLLEIAAAVLACLGVAVIVIAYHRSPGPTLAAAVAAVALAGGLAYIVLSRRSQFHISRPRLALTILVGILMLATGALVIWLVSCSC